MPRLVIHKDRTGTQVFELTSGHPVSIGRAKSSNVFLDDASVSRTHAVIRSTPDGRWEIVDRDSANGLTINGRAVRETILHPNDEVTIGLYTVRFEEPDVRPVSTQNTVRWTENIAKELAKPAYSGSFLPVVPLASAAPDSGSAERLRELERENRLLKVLYRVSSALGRMETVDEITERILDLVLELEGAQRGYAMLLSEEAIGQADSAKGEYDFRPAVIRYKRPPGELGKKPMPNLVISQSIVRRVMKTGDPLLIADAKDDPRLASSASVVTAGFVSAMCAPLTARERQYGLLYVDNLSRAGIFSDEELSVFALIAAQAGLAIDAAVSAARLA